MLVLLSVILTSTLALAHDKCPDNVSNACYKEMRAAHASVASATRHCENVANTCYIKFRRKHSSKVRRFELKNAQKLSQNRNTCPNYHRMNLIPLRFLFFRRFSLWLCRRLRYHAPQQSIIRAKNNLSLC